MDKNNTTPTTKTRKLLRYIALVVGIAGFVTSFALLLLSCDFDRPEPLTRTILNRSLELGTQFLLNHQKPEGNFTYIYDWVKKTYDPGDNQVRQAGAMWGLATIYQDAPNPEVGAAVEKAMDFFVRNSKLTPDGQRYVTYPGEGAGRIGTVALCALAHIDYLRTAKSRVSEEKFQNYRQLLEEYLEFLIRARMQTTPKAGLWHQSYSLSSGHPYGKPSPYFDGESLLALVKAAKYMGREDLQPIIIASADAGYHHNIQEALQEDPDSSTTKGYYQWSSMIFFEIATSGWSGTEKYGDYVIELANWMVDVHKTLKKTRNTAYAYEGIIHAYQLAVQRNDTEHIKKFAHVIETGLTKLTSWQIGSPLMNGFIRSQSTNNPLAIGGVQNHRRESLLRIDVAQHQMHAVILARRYVYK
jgi:UDP-N-acetylmuramoyl-tripeptide--D-alanyl-D-alanine ligase